MATAVTAPFVASLLGRINPQWVRDVLPRRETNDIIAFMCTEYAAHPGQVFPPSDKVFEAFRYFDPDALSVVILGQDPYPVPGDATGLAFSSGACRVPQTLKNIYKALRTLKMMKDEETPTADLTPWALQGVLMINAALTIGPSQLRKPDGSIIHSHRNEWKQFTGKLIEAIVERACARGQEIDFLLWGKDARSYAPLINATVDVCGRRGLDVTKPPDDFGFVAKKIRALEYGHPSPLGKAHFENCGHFAAVNVRRVAAGLRPIVWNPATSVLVFTDGACRGNGTPAARASFGVCAATGALSGLRMCGMVEPFAYNFIDADDPAKGMTINDTPVVPTNIRGEFMGVCWALLLALRVGGCGAVHMVVDLKLIIDTLGDKPGAGWLAGWRDSDRTAAKLTADGIEVPKRIRERCTAGKSNMDLVNIASVLLDGVRARGRVVYFRHQHGHTAEPPVAEKLAHLLWEGNDNADGLAKSVIADGAESMGAAAGNRISVVSGPMGLFRSAPK